MTTVSIETAVCETCYLLIALGLPDSPTPTDLEAASKVIQFSTDTQVHLYAADSDGGYEDNAGFSWSDCPVCHSGLGGLRYSIVGLSR